MGDERRATNDDQRGVCPLPAVENDVVPLVSVVMAVYNGAQHLREAIDSVLGQTLTDFELVIVDDGSTDATAAILDSYADSRIVRLCNPVNLGLTRSLNRGLEVARGTLIARLDADDLLRPERLAAQADYLQAHQSVALVASRSYYVDDKGAVLGTQRPPLDPELLRWQLLFTNQFIHASAMWRRGAVERVAGCYDPAFVVAQDYDLWARVAEHAPIRVLPEVLIHKRVHAGAISTARRAEQDAYARQVSLRQLARFLPGVDEAALNDLYLLAKLARGEPARFSPERLRAACALLIDMQHSFLQAAPGSRAPVTADVDATLRCAAIKCGRWGWWRTGLAILGLREADHRPPTTDD